MKFTFFDINWYPFSVNETTDIRIDACASNFDTYLYFETANGARIAQCDDCGICGLQTQLDVDNVQPGDYRIGIGGYSDQYGNYSIHVICDYEPNSTFTPRPTQWTVTNTPTVSPSHSPIIGNGNGEDWYVSNSINIYNFIL